MQRHLLAILLLLPLLGCDQQRQQRTAQTTPSTPPMVQSAVSVLRDPRTTRVEVFWVPKEVATRTRLTPQLLEDIRNRKMNDSGFQGSELQRSLIQALQQADIQPGSDPGDLRWACIFHGAGNIRVLSIYFDGYGRKGLIQGTPVTSNGEVVAALEREFGIR